MGLLDFLGSDDAKLGLGLLAAAGPSTQPMNAFQRIQMAQQGMSADKAQAMKLKLMQSQIDETNAQALQRTQLSEMQGKKQLALRGAMSPDGKIDTQALLRSGAFTPEELSKYDGLRNMGRDKISRTEEIMVDGRPMKQSYDDYGTPIGGPQPVWKAPVSVDTGAGINFIDPTTMQSRGGFNKSQSPDSVASNATSASNAAMVDARSRESMAQGRIPSGFRPKGDGTLEYIPGGPADPNTKPAGGKPLNDTQAKALQFGSRMQEANDLFDRYAEGGVDRPGLLKRAADAVPGYMGGGVLAAGANWTQNSKQQGVEQAQRDFVNAILRRESGAAISESEFESAKKQYFPSANDDKDTIAQKKRNREIATRGILAEVPEAESRVASVRGAEAKTDAPKSKFISIGGKQIGAKLAPDGNYYVPKAGGGWQKVVE